MIKIEDNTTYILYKNKNSFSYTFQLKHTTPEKTENLFIESLSNQIPNSFLYENDNDKLSIIFTATTVTPITAEIVKGNIFIGNTMVKHGCTKAIFSLSIWHFFSFSLKLQL